MSEAVTHFQVVHQPGVDLRISDPAFRRDYSIEAPRIGDTVDAIFYEILTSPAGLRSLGVNQLSKSDIEETYAGSTDFKRWQHVAGAYHVVRHFARELGLKQDTTLVYALIACVPDLGHGVKSHVTDMLKEGMGGNENFHEQRTGQVLDLGGIQHIFDKYNIKSPFGRSGKVIRSVPRWVDGPSPGLSVDRLHYINAEISLMFPNSAIVADAIRLDNFVIHDNQLAFRAIDQARVWAKAANLCSSEHWNDPANRLIELLSLEAMKRTISERYLKNVDRFDNGYVGAPEDYTFLVDRDFDDALQDEALSRSPDVFMHTVYSLIQGIAHSERLRFTQNKRPAYEEYLGDPDAREYPNALVNPHRATFGIPPGQVEIKAHAADQSNNPTDAILQMSDGVPVGHLKKLKTRQFDPLVMVGRRAVPLSAIDPNFAKALEQNWRALNYVGVVALHANPESRAALIEGAEANRAYMKTEHASLSPDQMRHILASSGRRALKLAIREGRWIEKT